MEPKKKRLEVVAIDDDPTYRLYLEEILRISGFKATVVEHSSEVDEILGSRTIDALLIDIQLAKGESGIRLVRRYKDLNPRMAIILLSASALRSKELCEGIDDYLLKGGLGPDAKGGFETETLAAAIENVVYQKRMPLTERRRRFGMFGAYLPECEDAILRPKTHFQTSKRDGIVSVSTAELLRGSHDARWNLYRSSEHDDDTASVGLPSCVGCGRLCTFCMYRNWKFVRGLTADEITGMFDFGLNSLLARGVFKSPRQKRVALYFAHAGDPIAQNLRNCMQASIRALEMSGLDCKVVLTTTGDEASLKRLNREYRGVPVHIYWSLHSAVPTTRDRIMPITAGHNHRLPYIRDLLCKFSAANGLMFTSAMMDAPGVNDSDEEASAVYNLIGECRSPVKISPYSPSELEQVYQTASDPELLAYLDKLVTAGIRREDLRIRHIPGGDVYGGCGTCHPAFFPDGCNTTSPNTGRSRKISL